MSGAFATAIPVGRVITLTANSNRDSLPSLRWPTANEAELLDYGLDYSALLAQGETIASVQITSSPSEAGQAKATLIDVQNNVVTAWLSVGIAGQDVQFRVKVVTGQNRTLEHYVSRFVSLRAASYPVSPVASNYDFGNQVVWPTPPSSFDLNLPPNSGYTTIL